MMIKCAVVARVLHDTVLHDSLNTGRTVKTVTTYCDCTVVVLAMRDSRILLVSALLFSLEFQIQIADCGLK